MRVGGKIGEKAFLAKFLGYTIHSWSFHIPIVWIQACIEVDKAILFTCFLGDIHATDFSGAESNCMSTLNQLLSQAQQGDDVTNRGWSHKKCSAFLFVRNFKILL